MDNLDPKKRSALMARIRSKNTSPEIFVRRLVYRMGYRYRLHVRTLPGVPDLVFIGLKRVIWVHGCFWHYHAQCDLSRIPKTRKQYWTTKLFANRQRDRKHKHSLQKLGWKALIIWQCDLSRPDLKVYIKNFLR